MTCDDSEWIEYTDNKFQNKRNGAVFKNGKDGRPYYIDAWINVWEKDHSSSWGGTILLDDGTLVIRAYIKDFSQMPTITIPSPTTHGEEDSDWDFLPIPRANLSELEKYYDLEIQPI